MTLKVGSLTVTNEVVPYAPIFRTSPTRICRLQGYPTLRTFGGFIPVIEERVPFLSVEHGRPPYVPVWVKNSSFGLPFARMRQEGGSAHEDGALTTYWTLHERPSDINLPLLRVGFHGCSFVIDEHNRKIPIILNRLRTAMNDRFAIPKRENDLLIGLSVWLRLAPQGDIKAFIDKHGQARFRGYGLRGIEPWACNDGGAWVAVHPATFINLYYPKRRRWWELEIDDPALSDLLVNVGNVYGGG